MDLGDICNERVTNIYVDGGNVCQLRVADKVLRDAFSVLAILGVVLRKYAWSDKRPVSMGCVMVC